MRTKVLVTDGGPHSADDLGLATAEQITDTDPNITDDRKIAAAKLRLEMASILSRHHLVNQEDERARLLADEALSPEDEQYLVESALDAVIAAADTTPWQQHYARPEVQQVIRYIIAKDLQHSRHIERQWHKAAKDST